VSSFGLGGGRGRLDLEKEKGEREQRCWAACWSLGPGELLALKIFFLQIILEHEMNGTIFYNIYHA
jgi:hypothetical protein